MPIPEQLYEILDEHLLRTGRTTGLIFGRTEETPFSYSAVRERAERVWKEAGLEPSDLQLHEGRHSYSSFLSAAGVADSRADRYTWGTLTIRPLAATGISLTLSTSMMRRRSLSTCAEPTRRAGWSNCASRATVARQCATRHSVLERFRARRREGREALSLVLGIPANREVSAQSSGGGEIRTPDPPYDG